jgi:hypothetical protein
MAANDPSDKRLRGAFKDWALKKITSTPDHPLQCLVDDRTGRWYENAIGFPNEPAVDSGHRTSKWTGAPQCFALEDSDFNRIFNRGENPRQGVFFQKPAVSIGEVPIDRRTAEMLERTGKLKPGTVAAAPQVEGAKYSTETGEFKVEGAEQAPIAPSKSVPSLNSNVSIRGKIGNVASNQDAVAFIGVGIGVVSSWINEKRIARKVEEQLRTTYSDQIRTIHQNGQGALVIVRIERYAYPSPDYHLENAELMGIDVVGGANFEEAMSKWKQPKYLIAPDPDYRVDESYMWLTAPKAASANQ